MSMPLPMKLRTRLFLSISALITVSLFGLLLGLFSVMQLGRAQEQRMSHHYATIEVSQQLRQLLGDQLVILLRETPDGQALERSQNDFRRVLEQGRANTVDSAEQAALDGVRDAYLQLQAHTPALLEAPMADNDGFSEASMACACVCRTCSNWRWPASAKPRPAPAIVPTWSPACLAWWASPSC